MAIFESPLITPVYRFITGEEKMLWVGNFHIILIGNAFLEDYLGFAEMGNGIYKDLCTV
jgi:hypothetical protein